MRDEPVITATGSPWPAVLSETAWQTVAWHRRDAVLRDWPADLVEIPSPQLSRLRHLDERLCAQEISELRETGSSQDLIIRCLRTMAGCGTRGADLERR